MSARIFQIAAISVVSALAGPGTSWAQLNEPRNILSEIQVEPDRLMLEEGKQATVSVKLSGDATYCGLRIEYGDGETENVKIDNSRGLFPRAFSHTYTRPGEFEIRAFGEKVTNHYPCGGKLSARVAVVSSAAMSTTRGETGLPERLSALLELANRGDIDAMNRLGDMYRLGSGVERSYRDAAMWYRRTAERNSLVGLLRLGQFYRSGMGVPKDKEEAFRLLNTAAQLGNATAMYELGVMYLLGEGTSYDPVYAYAWFSMAMARSNDQSVEIEARDNRSQLKESLSKKERQSAEQLVEKFRKSIRKAAYR